MPSVGPLELAIVLIIALVIFGPKRLPELGRSLGSGMKEFRASISGGSDDDEEEPRKIQGSAEPAPEAAAPPPVGQAAPAEPQASSAEGTSSTDSA